MKRAQLQELATLYFTTRQIIRSQLPQGKADPNAWLRFETLRFVAAKKDATMSDVAAYLRIKAPSATSLIGHLVTKDLVHVEACRTDKRLKRLKVTKLGRIQLRRYEHRGYAALHRVFSGLSDRDLSELLALLRKVSDMHTG